MRKLHLTNFYNPEVILQLPLSNELIPHCPSSPQLENLLEDPNVSNKWSIRSGETEYNFETSVGLHNASVQIGFPILCHFIDVTSMILRFCCL